MRNTHGGRGILHICAGMQIKLGKAVSNVWHGYLYALQNGSLLIQLLLGGKWA